MDYLVGRRLWFLKPDYDSAQQWPAPGQDFAAWVMSLVVSFR